MGRRKSIFNEGDKPTFKYYKNRKTYFSNASKYVTHEEARDIIAKCNGDFEVHGIDKEKFLLKILSAENTVVGSSEILFRAIRAGGFVAYIQLLEGMSLPAIAMTNTSSEVSFDIPS